MLHLIAENSLQASVVERIATGDDVILQGGVVWSVLIGHSDNQRLIDLIDRGCKLYALQDVLSAGGITEEQLLPGVQAIDYAAFVDLTVKNPVIHTWS